MSDCQPRHQNEFYKETKSPGKQILNIKYYKKMASSGKYLKDARTTRTFNCHVEHAGQKFLWFQVA